MWIRVGCALGIVGSSWLWGASASAAPTIPTKLVWQGSVCGTADSFASRVLERTGAVRFVQKGHRLAVRLRIERRPTGLDASVAIEGRGSALLRRRIESPDCDDALDALALVVAIGVEGRARSAASPSAAKARRPAMVEPPPATADAPSVSVPAPPVDSGPSLTPAPSSSTSPGIVSAPTPDTVPVSPEPAPAPTVVVQTPDPRVDLPSPAPSPDSGPFRLGAGLSGQLSFGIAPDPMLGGALWIAAGWERDGAWSPELLFSATHQRLDGLAMESGAVDFALSAASVAVCPLRLGRSALSVRPCADASLGRLATEAHDTYDPQSMDRPWGTLGGSLSLAAALGVVELRASLAASAPLVRDGFRFGADCSGSACQADVFHRVASVIWSGAAGAGVVFW